MVLRQRMWDRRPGKRALAAAIAAAAVVVIAAGAFILRPSSTPPTPTLPASASRTLAREVTAIPIPASTAHAGYPFDRALTAAELAAFLADPSLKPGTTFAARVTIQQKSYCEGYSATGVLLGIPPRWCVRNASINMPQVTGVFALRYLSPGWLESVGGVKGASPDRLVHKSDDGWPWALTAYTTFLTQGYLVRGESTFIVTSPPDRMPTDRDVHGVIVDPGAGVDSIDGSTYHVFVVTAVWIASETETDGMRISTDGIEYHLGGVIDDLPVPATTGLTDTGPPATPSGS
jgi:hypothetical protein